MTATLYHRTSRVVSHGSPSTLLQETAQTLQSLGPVNRSPQYLIIENYRYISRYQILFDIQCGNTAKPVNRFLKILTAYAQACIKVFLVLKVLILRITKLSLPIDAHSLYHFLVKPSFFLVFAPIPPMLMPRITFAHGTSPFTSDQLKLGRAGEPKGWNGHGGLKVLCSLCLALLVFTIAHFVFSRWSQSTLFTLSDTLRLHQQDALFNYSQKDLFLHCWRVGLIEQGATDLLDQVDFLFIMIL